MNKTEKAANLLNRSFPMTVPDRWRETGQTLRWCCGFKDKQHAGTFQWDSKEGQGAGDELLCLGILALHLTGSAGMGPHSTSLILAS